MGTRDGRRRARLDPRGAQPGATGSRRRSPRKVLVVVALAIMVVTAACGGSGDGSDPDRASGVDEGSAGAPDSGGAAEAAGADGTDATSVDLTRAVSASGVGRAVVSTAALEVEVTDLATAAARAVSLTEAGGGHVFAETSNYGDERRSVLTLKVAPEEFRPLLASLADLGRAVTQDVTTEEVTERVVDLESRITTAETSIGRLRGYLEGAADVESLARLESELLVRETDLETIRGQLRTLEDRVEQATIVVTLVEVDEGTERNEATGMLAAFEQGLRGGWGALVVATTVALALAGALLPWVPLALVVALGWRLARRVGAWISARAMPRAST